MNGEATPSGAAMTRMLSNEPLEILQPHETALTGHWVVVDRNVQADATCERINWLVTTHLNRLAIGPQSGGWEVLFRDPNDGRYWEQTYPQSELHGGGPPQLLCLSEEVATAKYQLPAQ